MNPNTKRGFNILEVILVIALIGAIAIIVVPRIQQANLASRESSCFSNVKRIDKQIELWQATRGSLPADITQIGADPGLFPEGIPLCPVSGAAYFLDANSRVAQHLNGNHTPVPGVPPPPPPPGGGFITWAWDGFTISDGLGTSDDIGIHKTDAAVNITNASTDGRDVDVGVGDEMAEGDARLLWFTGDMANAFYSIQELEEGGYIALGYGQKKGIGVGITLVRIDENGEILWAKRYSTGYFETAHQVQRTSDGGFVLLGSVLDDVRNQAEKDIFVMKVNQDGEYKDAQGNLLQGCWAKRYGGSGPFEEGKTLRQTSDGNFIIAGKTRSLDSGDENSFDSYVLKLDSTSGDVAWSRTYNYGYSSKANSVRELVDGDYIVAGHTEVNPYSTDDATWVIKLDPETGFLRTTESHPAGFAVKYQTTRSQGNRLLDIDSIAETFDGDFVMTGMTGKSAVLVKIDAEGNVKWGREYGDARRGETVIETADGGYAILGSYGDTFSLIKVDSNGNLKDQNGEPLPGSWVKKYSAMKNNHAYSVWQANDGGYILAGQTNSHRESGDPDSPWWAMFTIKTDDEGNVLFDE